MSGANPCETQACPMEETMDNRRKWHLDRGINPAYIIPLITAILAVLGWAGNVNAKDALQDEKIASNAKQISEINKNSREDAKLIQQKLDDLRTLIENSRRR